MNKHNNDREYAILLLLACIDSLARDLAVKTDLDPQYLITKTMLKKSLVLQRQGLERVSSILKNDHAWLFDHIENLVY